MAPFTNETYTNWQGSSPTQLQQLPFSTPVAPTITYTGPSNYCVPVIAPFSAWINGAIIAPTAGAYIDGWGNDFGLITLDLGNVVGVGFTGLQVGGGALTSLSAASLVVCLGGIEVEFCSLVSVDLSALQVCGFVEDSNSIGFTFHNTLLTSLNLPAIVYASQIKASNTSTLTSVSIGSSLKTIVTSVDFSGCGLDQASVDGILARLVALDGTNGTTIFDGAKGNSVDLSGGTSSAPSTAGAANATILTNRGVTVTTN